MSSKINYNYENQANMDYFTPVYLQKDVFDSNLFL